MSTYLTMVGFGEERSSQEPAGSEELASREAFLLQQQRSYLRALALDPSRAQGLDLTSAEWACLPGG